MRPASLTILALLTLTITLRAADEPKKDPPKAEEKKPAVRTETIVGKIVSTDSQKNTIKVQANPQSTRANPLIVQAINAARASVRDVYKIRNAQERAAALKELDDKIKMYERDLYVYTVDAGSDNKVRVPYLKEMFDDMGNIKKITPAERAKLMGKDRMFDGDWADLKMGQIVSVTYVAPAPRKKGKPDELGPATNGNLESTKVVVVQDLPQMGPKK